MTFDEYAKLFNLNITIGGTKGTKLSTMINELIKNNHNLDNVKTHCGLDENCFKQYVTLQYLDKKLYSGSNDKELAKKLIYATFGCKYQNGEEQ